MTDASPDRAPRRVGLIVNPERPGLTETVTEAMRARSIDVEEVRVEDAAGLGRGVRELLDRHVDVVAAIGGDGTQRTVAEALAGSDVPLGIVPGGTVNLLAWVLGIPDVDAAIDAIAGGRCRTIDAGRVGDELFVLNASTGWDAGAIHRVDDTYKRFGRLGYFAAGLRQWFAEDALPVTVRLEDRVWYDGPALTVVVLNAGQRGSEHLDLAPDASIDDGRLDVVVLRRRSAVAFARSAWCVVRGRPPQPGDLVRSQAGTIEVEWSAAVRSQRDGDDAGVGVGTTFRHEVAAGALRVCVPRPDEVSDRA